MAVSLIRHPLRIDGINSRLVVAEQGSLEYRRDQVRSLLLTNKGERPLSISFGIRDPSFVGFDGSDFILSLREFYTEEEIEIVNLSTRYFDNRNHVEIQFK